MKVCITSAGKDLNSLIDPRFGRCEFFIIVDIETLGHRVEPNLGSEAVGGAGIQAAQKIARLGVEAVITGNIGPNAFDVLRNAGIKIFTGASGTVRETINDFKMNRLREADSATSLGHASMKGGGRGRV